MVIQETRGQTDPQPGGHIGEGGIMIRAVKIFYLPGIDQPVLDCFQDSRASSWQFTAGTVRRTDMKRIERLIIVLHAGFSIRLLLPDDGRVISPNGYSVLRFVANIPFRV